MDIVNSYKVKLINANKVFEPTIIIYREALTFIVEVVNNEWDSIKSLTTKEKINLIERLIHATTKNPYAKYDFDKKFYKFPSYLRRSAISEAIGIVSSYKSKLSNYEEERYNAVSNGRSFKKKAPRLSVKHFKNPVMYKGNMYNMYSRDEVLLKLFINNDWVWKSFKLRNQDLKYIEKNCYLLKESNPTLIKSGRNAYLSFSYESKGKLNNTKTKEQIVIGVDLGLNCSAVCSAIKYNGTVVDRKFINKSTEKDHLNHLLNRTKKKRRQTGKGFKMPRVWNKINNLNQQIINDTVSKIIKFAIKNNASVIVFEYLNFKGKKPKNIALRFQMWAKRLIQEKVKHKAHYNGIRYSRVCAKNTSSLAFDGTGNVDRSKVNASLCTFKTGKQYNCDLNATYNIGSRYFIREIQKSVSEKKWSQALAKVPELVRRTQCTLSTLINLVVAL